MHGTGVNVTVLLLYRENPKQTTKTLIWTAYLWQKLTRIDRPGFVYAFCFAT